MEGINYKNFPILLVDDEKDNLFAFETEFEEYFQILTASSGKEALKLLEKTGEVAVAIIDQRMPEMTGVELLKEIVLRFPDTIRILITAYSDIEVVVEAINSGNVYKYIAKPWEHEDVRLSIMRAIETYYLTKDREKLIEEKVNAAKKAAEANRLASLGMLAAGIAHEINNPLVSVNTFMKLLPQKLKDLLPAKSEQYDQSFWSDFYKLVDNELKRVQSLVRELLNLAKPPKYDFEETNIVQLIRSEAQLFESAVKEKDVRFRLDLDENLPPIRCDSNRIKQLLLNLVLNAIQATSKGGQVSIRAAKTEGGKGPQIEISVIDTGEGISDEVKRKIFQPFFSTKSKGTGLGLMICDFVVKHHGGDIRVESEVGKGTRFIVTLPVQSQPAMMEA